MQKYSLISENTGAAMNSAERVHSEKDFYLRVWGVKGGGAWGGDKALFS